MSAPARKAPAKPQDRKPPQPKVVDIEGGKKVTARGITVTVLDEALNDFELLDDLASLDKRNAAALPNLLRRLVGTEQFIEVMDGLRAANGRVPMDAGTEFLSELFGALNPNS